MKMIIIIEVIKSFEPKLRLGEIFSLSDVANIIKEKYGPDYNYKHTKIKSCLLDYFNEKIGLFTQKTNKKLNCSFYTTKEKSWKIIMAKIVLQKVLKF